MLDYLAQLVRHGRIDPVEYYVSDRHRAVYVENAKVACTAIKAAMFPDAAAKGLSQTAFHEALRGHAHHRLPTSAYNYLVFTFVRHPEARLQSCYRDKVQRTAQEEGPSILHRRFHRGLFAALGGVDIRADGLPFDRFAQAVARIPDRVSDRHFASQSRAVEAVQRAENSFVGQLETLRSDWAEIQAKTGLPDLAIANRSEAEGGRAAASPVARSIIARRYARDFKVLGYAYE